MTRAWAPCLHNNDTPQRKREVIAWAEKVLESPHFVPKSVSEAELLTEASVTEEILWIVSSSLGVEWPDIVDVHWGFYADQWVAVTAAVKFRDGTQQEITCEADNFTLGMLWILEQLKELGHGREPDIQQAG